MTVQQIKTPVNLSKLDVQGADVSRCFGAERVQIETQLGNIRLGGHFMPTVEGCSARIALSLEASGCRRARFRQLLGTCASVARSFS